MQTTRLGKWHVLSIQWSSQSINISMDTS